MMPRHRLLILLVIVVLVLAAASWLSSRRATPRDPDVGTKVLPMLAAHLNDVNELRVVKAGDVPAVTLRRGGAQQTQGGWQVVERGNYPADLSKVREALLPLSQLEIVEVKTSDPANYALLGVEDLKTSDPKSTAKRLDLGGVKPPISLLVGKSSDYGQNYLRVAGVPRVLLAKPQLSIADEPPAWLDHALLDIPSARVQEVRVVVPERKLAPIGPAYTLTRATREQDDFTIPKLPKGRSLPNAAAANPSADALTNLYLDDVRPVAAIEDWSKDDVARAEYRLFDGTVITLLGRKLSEKPTGNAGDDSGDKSSGAVGDSGAERHWVRVAVSFDEAQRQRFALAPAENQANQDQTKADRKVAPAPTTEKSAAEVRAEAQKLAARLKDWEYELPGYKYDAIFKPLEALLKKN
jgi:hypothetical protein